MNLPCWRVSPLLAGDFLLSAAPARRRASGVPDSRYARRTVGRNSCRERRSHEPLCSRRWRAILSSAPGRAKQQVPVHALVAEAAVERFKVRVICRIRFRPTRRISRRFIRRSAQERTQPVAQSLQHSFPKHDSHPCGLPRPSHLARGPGLLASGVPRARARGTDNSHLSSLKKGPHVPVDGVHQLPAGSIRSGFGLAHRYSSGPAHRCSRPGGDRPDAHSTDFLWCSSADQAGPRLA